MPQRPLQGDVHVNVPLTNLSVALHQTETNFVASRVFPNVPVEQQGNRFYTFDRGNFNRDDMEERADGTESSGGAYTVDNTPTYFARVYAFHHDIGDQRRANSDSVLAPDREATKLCTMKALIKKEKLFVTNFFTTSIWTGIKTGVASGPTSVQVLQWDQANSTPIEDIWEAKASMLELTGFEPTHLTLGYRVFKTLINHPDIIDRVKYGQMPGSPAMISEAELAALFKIPNVLVMRSIQNTAKENQTNVHSFIGGKHALLTYSPSAPGLETPASGYTFSWTGLTGAGTMGQVISKFRLQQNKADRIEIEMAFDMKVVTADLGFFFASVIG